MVEVPPPPPCYVYFGIFTDPTATSDPARARLGFETLERRRRLAELTPSAVLR